MTRAKLRVIYGDTDQMGVVYHANYLRFFEAARNEYFRDRGGSYRELEGEGFQLPVVEARVKYKAPARYDDLVEVEVGLGEVRRATFTFNYILRRDGEDRILATGETVHACLDTSGRPIRIPERLLHQLQTVPA
jgi:acyl-CoA thioester hydrolase